MIPKEYTRRPLIFMQADIHWQKKHFINRAQAQMWPFQSVLLCNYVNVEALLKQREIEVVGLANKMKGRHKNS